MAYVDPSRVQLALRFADLAERSPAEREPSTGDLQIFLAGVWADATGGARTRYSAALARVGGALPWSAVRLPVEPGPGTPALRGPAVVELLVGHEDPDDEGVPRFRLRAGDPRAEAVLAAMYAWDVDTLERAAAPAGWRLDTDMSGNTGVLRGSGGANGEVEDDEPVSDGDADIGSQMPDGDASATKSSGAAWKLGAVAAGFAALGFAAWKWG
jgi:hypothetical protein